jgi:Mrp family chromosome partitioning ATPase
MAIVQSEDFERKTLLVELDFDNPSLARSLGVNNEGISELVEGDIPVAQAVQALSPDLLVAVAGRARRSAPGVAHRLVEGGVLANLCAEFDVVVADLPPLLASSLGPQVTAMMQTVLLVVRAGVTPAAQVREAAALLTSEPLVILNDVTSHIPRWARRIAGH